MIKAVGNGMSIGDLILGVNGVTVLYLIRYNSLLKNVTDINTKRDSYFITKCDRNLQQNESGFLLQNATVLLQIFTTKKFKLYSFSVSHF